MKQILIADDDITLAKKLKSAAEKTGLFRAESVPDGKAALAYLKRNRADILVLDLVMPGKDGFAVLESLQKFSVRPRTLIISALYSSSAVSRAAELGADLFLAKPFSPALLVQRLIDLSVPEKETEENRLTGLLLRLGIPAHMQGFIFLREAVLLAKKQRGSVIHITRDLYPAVAQSFGVAPSKVERTIRSALDAAAHPEELNALTGSAVWQEGSHLKNGQLISLLSEVLCMEEK